MNSDLIVTQFEKLKLYGMAEAASDLLLTPVQMRPSMETVLTKLVETETRHRDDKKTARLLKGQSSSANRSSRT